MYYDKFSYKKKYGRSEYAGFVSPSLVVDMRGIAVAATRINFRFKIAINPRLSPA